MKILITGADGFVGKNLAETLKNIKEGKDKSYPGLTVSELYLYDINSPAELLDEACGKADFVFNLAGVNRPKSKDEFMQGNCGFARRLLDNLERHGNKCPVMLSSSVQASLEGRYDNDYGRSKRAAEEIFLEYAEKNGAKALIYRLPNLFGKWCRPNYNSVVATFCHNIANDLPITVNDETTELELLYIDDLVNELIMCLLGRESRSENGCCTVAPTHKVTLGEIVKHLEGFKAQQDTLIMPEIREGSFAKKLYSAYLSYLPREKVCHPFKMNADARGSFTELVKTASAGQFSVNISKPGVTKGQHWHSSKWEMFIVVSGRALIEMRKIGTDEVLSFEVDGEKIEAVYMLPGYTHSITNLSDSEDLVTLMWANEQFNPNKPDTFYEVVNNE